GGRRGCRRNGRPGRASERRRRIRRRGCPVGRKSRQAHQGQLLRFGLGGLGRELAGRLAGRFGGRLRLGRGGANVALLDARASCGQEVVGRLPRQRRIDRGARGGRLGRSGSRRGRRGGLLLRLGLGSLRRRPRGRG